MYSSDAANTKHKLTKYAKNDNQLINEDKTQSQKSQMKTSREQELKTAYEILLPLFSLISHNLSLLLHKDK